MIQLKFSLDLEYYPCCISWWQGTEWGWGGGPLYGILHRSTCLKTAEVPISTLLGFDQTMHTIWKTPFCLTHYVNWCWAMACLTYMNMIGGSLIVLLVLAIILPVIGMIQLFTIPLSTFGNVLTVNATLTKRNSWDVLAKNKRLTSTLLLIAFQRDYRVGWVLSSRCL